jgi:SAM-dependent methyltransferase
MESLVMDVDVFAQSAREKKFFDDFYKVITPHVVDDPYLSHADPKYRRFLRRHESAFANGNRILVCSCGLGLWPLLFAMRGLRVEAFDISTTAVEKAIAFAKLNNCESRIRVEEMNFYDLKYEPERFDYVFGESILHHVDCHLASLQVYRVLKQGGKAYFLENSARNPLLRFARDFIFARNSFGGKQQKGKFGFRRHGDLEEAPLSEEEVKTFCKPFKNLTRTYELYTLFSLLAMHGPRIFGKLQKGLLYLDEIMGKIPIFYPLSMEQTLILEK